MKNFKLIPLSIIVILFFTNVNAQDADPSLSVQTSNAGVVEVGAINEITLTIANSKSGNIPVGRMRPFVAVPPSVVFLADALQTGLPAGFTIVSNSGSILRVCNSSVNLPGFGIFSIILKIRGVTEAPATTIQGQFNPAINCLNGPNIAGDVQGNNAPTTTIQVIAATVPLTLTSFTGTLKNCMPALSWVTESEVNTKSFEIEKSNTNGNDWKKIGSINANGNSSTKIAYSYNDIELSGAAEKVFYKLKMIDKDGRFTYSPILPLNITCKEASINVYPNPVVDGKLSVIINGANGLVDAALFTLTGQQVARYKVVNGSNNMVLKNVVEGTYILTVNDNNGFNKNVKVFVKH